MLFRALSTCHLFQTRAHRISTRQLQTAVFSHPLKIGHIWTWTYLLGTVHTTTS